MEIKIPFLDSFCQFLTFFNDDAAVCISVRRLYQRKNGQSDSVFPKLYELAYVKVCISDVSVTADVLVRHARMFDWLNDKRLVFAYAVYFETIRIWRLQDWQDNRRVLINKLVIAYQNCEYDCLKERLAERIAKLCVMNTYGAVFATKDKLNMRTHTTAEIHRKMADEGKRKRLIGSQCDKCSGPFLCRPCKWLAQDLRAIIE